MALRLLLPATKATELNTSNHIFCHQSVFSLCWSWADPDTAPRRTKCWSRGFMSPEVGRTKQYHDHLLLIIYLAYFVIKDGLPFAKFLSMLWLQVKSGSDLSRLCSCQTDKARVRNSGGYHVQDVVLGVMSTGCFVLDSTCIHRFLLWSISLSRYLYKDVLFVEFVNIINIKIVGFIF